MYKNWVNEYGRFPSDIEDNNMNVKLSAWKTAQSVVCLISYSGDEQLFICCGIIIECERTSDTCIATVLTSATLLRSPDDEAKLANDLKIDVYTVCDESIKGKLLAVDLHYNVALIEIPLDSPLAIPDVKFVNNVMEVGVNVPKKHSDRESGNTSHQFRLYNGVKVLALARYYEEPYDIMAASGEVSPHYCSEFGCKELLRTRCKIKKNGIGGPLINLHGDVIGINFYEESYTPFLPMNIVMKCFEDLKKNGYVSHTSLGVAISDLHTTSLRNLEIMCNKFPHVKGVVIDEVLPDTPAHIAGLCCNDVIINCGGSSIGSCLQLTEMLWGKEGEAIDMVVVRSSDGEQLTLSMDVVNAPRENRWSVPKRRRFLDHLFMGY